MLALYVLALICWVSVTHSAPLSCENLLQPLDKLEFRDLKGGFSLVSASFSDPANLEKLKERDSSNIFFANHSDTSTVSFTLIISFDDTCQYMRSNITLQSSGFTFAQSNATMTLLQTSCPDCAVIRFYDNSDKPVRFYLFSRRREVEPKEMEEFKAQAECLNMSVPIVMDPTKELCPEETSSDSAAATEETTEGQKA